MGGCGWAGGWVAGWLESSVGGRVVGWVSGCVGGRLTGLRVGDGLCCLALSSSPPNPGIHLHPQVIGLACCRSEFIEIIMKPLLWAWARTRVRSLGWRREREGWDSGITAPHTTRVPQSWHGADSQALARLRLFVRSLARSFARSPAASFSPFAAPPASHRPAVAVAPPPPPPPPPPLPLPPRRRRRWRCGRSGWRRKRRAAAAPAGRS